MTEPANPWGWWASQDEETYIVGPEASREAVIAAAAVDFDGEDFHIIEAVAGCVEQYIPSGDDVIGWVLESAADDGLFGESGDADMSGAKETQAVAVAELDTAIKAWTQKWKHLLPVPWRFGATRNREYIALCETEAQGEVDRREAPPDA